MAGKPINEVIPGWREELGGYLKEIFEFSKNNTDPLYIMKRLSAFSARASYIRSVVIKSKNREAGSFRLEEVDPFLKEVELQFRIWSRAAALVKDEWEMSRN